MNADASVQRGARFLRRFVAENLLDLRAIGLDDFKHWLLDEISSRENDPVFAARLKVRDLRRSCPELRKLETALEQARQRDAASPEFQRLETLEKEIQNSGQAVQGLQSALEKAPALRRDALNEKLRDFRLRQETLSGQRAAALAANQTRAARLAAETQLSELRQRSGLEEAEARLQEILRRQGQRAGRVGSSFEDIATAATREFLLPGLAGKGDLAGQRVRVLSGVTLGCARAELDQLIVRKPLRPGAPVKALAIVEAKRNINDLAHGFKLRQENIAWLTGDEAAYDSQLYRTSHYTRGHFDRQATHDQDGETFLFDRSSFSLFRREPDSGHFLRRLCFVTREGRLFGMSAGQLSKLMHRAATDEKWDPDSDTYWRSLHRWTRELGSAFESPEVIALYAATAPLGRNMLVVGRS